MLPVHQLPEIQDLIGTFLLKQRSENTKRAYTSDLGMFFGTSRVNMDLAKSITFINVNKYIEGLEADGLTATTIARKVSVIRSFYDWLMALGVIVLNPAAKPLIRPVKSTSSRNKVVYYLTPQQMRLVLLSTRTTRDYTIIAVMMYCALRRSEVVDLKVENIKKVGDRTVIMLPKSKGGNDQFVVVPSHAVEILERHIDGTGITSGPVFKGPQGGRLSADWVYKIVKQAAERAGINGVGAHTLRHTGCTLALAGGATVVQVMEHARHKNIETTMRYIHNQERLSSSAGDSIRI